MPSAQIVIGGDVVTGRLPGESDLHDGVSKVTMFCYQAAVVAPVLDVDNGCLILGSESLRTSSSGVPAGSDTQIRIPIVGWSPALERRVGGGY